jgi:PAS domain S-box-containing protein
VKETNHSAVEVNSKGLQAMDSLKLVVVEDEEAHFQLMKRAIDRVFQAASVEHFTEADSCLKRLNEITPDVIIADYLMPGMNGIEFFKASRSVGKDIPVIIITGQGDEKVAVQAMKLGASDYLVKAGDFSSLLPGVIDRVVRGRRLRDSLEQSETKFEQIFQQSPIGIALHDANGLLFDANKSCLEIFGVSGVAQIKGLNLSDYLNISLNEVKKSVPGKTARHEGLFDFEKLRKDNLFQTTRAGVIELDASVTPMGVKTGCRIVGYLVQIQDVTERRRAEEQIHTLTRELMMIQEKERQRISRELHDTVSQDLSALKIMCASLSDSHPELSTDTRQRVSEISAILAATIGSVRDLAYDLRPPALDALGLVRTISMHCEDFSERTGLNVDFSSVGVEGLRLDPDTQINLFRLIQEGLNNVITHADANQAFVRLVASFPDIILRIEDDGKGFDVQRRLATAHHEKRMGLQSMEERTALLGGNMRIESRPMQGTKITVKVPIPGT